MYKFLALLTGILISTFVTLNGKLTGFYGIYLSSAIIHLAGAVFAILIFAFQRKKIHFYRKNIPLWFYSGGIIGVMATVFNNFSFGKIPVTNIIALGLLGQIIFSLIIDQFGLFNLEKHKINYKSLAGIILSFAGVLYMIDFSDMTSLIAILFSFAAGLCIVMVRSVNANLGENIGQLDGALVHHIVGFVFSLVLMFLFSNDLNSVQFVPKNPLLYMGGVLGLIVVLIYNIIVPHVSAYAITLLSFIGQVFTGLFIDYILGSQWNVNVIVGCGLLCLGIAVTNILTKNKGLQN